MDKNRNFIQNIFSNVHEKYDLMNDIMSIGMHRIWKNDLMGCIKEPKNSKALDIAAGSGDITNRLIDLGYDACAADPNEDMMKNIKCNKVVCTAEDIPFDDSSFDFVTVAFGCRNFSDINKALNEIKRIIKNEGHLYCLEFSHPSRKIKLLYNKWLKCIPHIGKVVSNDFESYKYLSDSIKKFPNALKFKQIMEDIFGIGNVKCYKLTFGIVAIHIARVIK